MLLCSHVWCKFRDSYMSLCIQFCSLQSFFTILFFKAFWKITGSAESIHWHFIGAVIRNRKKEQNFLSREKFLSMQTASSQFQQHPLLLEESRFNAQIILLVATHGEKCVSTHSHPFSSDNTPLDSPLDRKSALPVVDWISAFFSVRFLFEKYFSQ